VTAFAAHARFPFSPFPTGWYAVAFTRDLPPGQVRSRLFAGREVVLFRGASGRAAVLPAHCPHMGAHLGEGGSVRGDALRCPMHGFEFDAEGRCVATGYGTRPPPTCRAQAYPVIEQNGIVLAFFDALGRAPSWRPPAEDMRGFGPLRTHVFAGLASHPQETTENSVDIGHLGAVHGYEQVRTLDPLATDAQHLTTRYAVTRRGLLPGTPAVAAEFTIHVYGLGYSFVDVDVRSHHLRTRHFVLATPTDGERIDLHLGTAVAGSGKWLGRVPGVLLDRAIGALVLRGFLADVQQDFRIWSHKVYVHPPALAQGDGPIGRYRSWAKQFYPDLESAPEPTARVSNTN
jgi:nitrite reductase/ring-hydroxylating ferredoxin subunit